MTLEMARSTFEAYCQANERNPMQDDTLLQSAREQVMSDIALNGRSKEAVRLAHRILSFLGDTGLQERERLLRSYLAESLDTDERFWANWELVDTLALLKKSRDTVDEQLAFLQWTKANMPSKQWAAAMYDGTQAHCWAAQNRISDWFAIYFELIDCIDKTEETRGNRATYVRTAGELMAMYDMLDEALQEAERLLEIVDEDDRWTDRVIFWLGAGTTKLEVFRKRQAWDSYDEQVHRIMAELHNAELSVDHKRFIANDLGACLMWAGRYAQAQTLFEFKVAHGEGGVAHYFLAICIWAATKDREKTLHHLAMAEHEVLHNPNMRGRYYDRFIEQPEFSDVWGDRQFRAIFSSK